MHNIKEFIDMNEKDFDSFFNILDNSFPKSERRDYPSQKDLLSISNYMPQPVTMPVRSWYAINSKTPLLY